MYILILFAQATAISFFIAGIIWLLNLGLSKRKSKNKID